MSKIIFQEPFIGVKKAKSKLTPKGLTTDANQFIKMPDEANNLGTVAFASESNTPLVGKNVYFGSSICQIRIAGEDVLICKPDQIFATVEEDQLEKPAA